MSRWWKVVSITLAVAAGIIGAVIGTVVVQTNRYGLFGHAAIVGGLGLMVVALRIFRDVHVLHPSMRDSSRSLGDKTSRLVAAATVTLVITLVAFGVWSRQTETPATRAQRKATKQLSEDPVFVAAFKGLSPSETKAKSAELGRRGIPRLDDASLRERAVLLCKILARLSESSCAAISRGTAGEDAQGAFASALLTLDPTDQEQWTQLSIKALRAELLQSPVPTLDSADVEAAFRHLYATFSVDEISAVDAAFNKKTATDAQAALAIRTLYAKALERPEPEASALLRELMSW